MKSFKIQSAMEYLMTYGWAILIIAVVLGALFSLGVFNGSNISGVTCIAAPGFLCQNPALATTGNLSVTLGQSTGSTFYNVGVSCATTATTATGLPNPVNSIIYINSNGLASNTLAYPANTGFLTLTSGQTVAVSALKCYSTSGTTTNALTGPAIGTTFSGGLWINYTLTSGAPSASNPMLTQKVTTMSLKVV